MSLILRSVQKTPTFNFNKLRDDIIALRRILRVDRFELAVVCMDEPQLRELNKMYNQKDETTDVLAFPRHQNLKPGKLPDPWSDVNDLGDIYLCVNAIQKRCDQNQVDLERGLPDKSHVPRQISSNTRHEVYGHINAAQTMKLAVTHGLCKLIGYKDDNLGQWRQMYDKEMDIIKKFNKATGSHVPLKPSAPPADNDLGPEEKKMAMGH